MRAVPAGRTSEPEGCWAVRVWLLMLDEVMSRLDRDGKLFAQYRTKVYLEQVLPKKEILKASRLASARYLRGRPRPRVAMMSLWVGVVGFGLACAEPPERQYRSTFDRHGGNMGPGGSMPVAIWPKGGGDPLAQSSWRSEPQVDQCLRRFTGRGGPAPERTRHPQHRIARCPCADHGAGERRHLLSAWMWRPTAQRVFVRGHRTRLPEVRLPRLSVVVSEPGRGPGRGDAAGRSRPRGTRRRRAGS
jgi:hypothetical protein